MDDLGNQKKSPAIGHTTSSFSVGKPFQGPRMIQNFVGRTELLVEVKKCLQPGKAVLLSGPPGSGKTATALKIGHEMREEFQDGILWYRVDTSSLSEVLTAIAHSFGENIAHIKDLHSKASLVRSLLGKKKALIILDNAEDAGMLSEILPNSPSWTLLITSTDTFATDLHLDHRFTLEPFSALERNELFSSIVGNEYVKEYQDRLDQLSDKLSNNPLALHLLAKQIFYEHIDLKRMLKIIDTQEFEIQRLRYDNKDLSGSIEAAYEQLPPHLQQIFISIALFEGKDFSVDAIAFIHRLTKEKAGVALQQLIRLSLVEYSFEARYCVNSLIKLFLNSKERSADQEMKCVQFYSQFLKKSKNNPDFYPEIENEYENILGAVTIAQEKKLFKELISIWSNLGKFLWDSGRWQKLEEIAALVLAACDERQDLEAKSLCLSRELAWLYFWQGKIPLAQQTAEESLTIATQLNDRFLIALAKERLGVIAQKQHKLDLSKQYLTAAAEVFRDEEYQEFFVDTLLYLGHVYKAENNLEIAKQHYLESLMLSAKINNSERNPIIVYYLGEINLKEHNFTQAKKFLAESLEIDTRNQRKAGIAWSTYGLAIAEQGLGNPQEANKLYIIASTIFQELGMTEQVKMIQEQSSAN